MFSVLTPASQDGRPDTISNLVATTIMFRFATCRSSPPALLTLGPTRSGWGTVWELGCIFSFPGIFCPFSSFLGFLFVEPLCSQRPSESAPSEPSYRLVWAEGIRLGISLRLLLRHSEDLFPFGAILHLVALTIDKTSGWSLASLLPLPLLAFLLALAPSFLSLASSVLWRNSLYNRGTSGE